MTIKERIQNLDVFLHNNGHLLAPIPVIAIGFLPMPAIILDLMIVLNFAFSLFILVYISIKKTTPFIFPKLLIIATKCYLLVCVCFMRLILAKGSDFESCFIRFLRQTDIEELIVLSAIFFVYIAFHIFTISKVTSCISEVSESFLRDSWDTWKANEDIIKIEDYWNGKEVPNKKIVLKKESNFYGDLLRTSDYISTNQKLLYLIIFATVFAGIYIGTYYRNESISDALVTYISLAISLGFIVLLPSFLLLVPVKIFHKIFFLWHIWYMIDREKENDKIDEVEKPL